MAAVLACEASHSPAQPRACARDARLHGSLGHAEPLRDLLVGKPLEHGELDRLALIGREPLERLPRQAQLLARGETLSRVALVRHPVERLGVHRHH